MKTKDNRFLAEEIRRRARSLGYDECGIIPTEELEGYAEKLSDRIRRFPDERVKLEHLYSFAHPEQEYPWAKSAIICTRPYGQYRVPEKLEGKIGKSYLFDSRIDEISEDYQASLRFERYLNEQGLRTVTQRKFSVMPLRWAAMKAGIGMIRKNNFLYTANGSWVYLEGWLIDKALELKEVSSLTHCPDSCHRCIEACPTKSLCEPYGMCRSSCISCITTWDGRDMPKDPYREQLGPWIYGCDICQEVCPQNKGKWTGAVDFPGIAEIADAISLEQIIEMDEETLQQVVQPKFWYIRKGDIWKWKVNALNAMYNSGEERYRTWISLASKDQNAKVREMAKFILRMIQ